MSDRHLGDILPQFARLFGGGVTTGLSDGALLRRYCSSRDEHAFTTLVERHGAMVLSVCRGVLRDKSQAEDAFQTVWLVLVRRAGSIRVDDSLGGWLHGVAYRVALRANKENAKRQERERTGLAVDREEMCPQSTTDPRMAALHEEIARLSDAHRLALVLCLLEGKTQVEAAHEIGCGEATIRRRLTGAKNRLRDRLKRRDVDDISPASLLALPPRLIDAATRAAGGPINSLATTVLGEMTRMHAIKMIATLVAFGVGTAGALGIVMAQSVPAQPATPKAPPVVVVVQKAVVADVELPEDRDPWDDNKWGNVEVPGRVVGPDGKPVAGATVFMRKAGVRMPSRKGTTDADGKFKITTFRRLGPRATETPKPKVTKQVLPGGITITITEPAGGQGKPHTDEQEIKWAKPWIVATAPGYGFGTPTPGDDVTIKLVPDEPITGRITDEDGKPLVGARIRVRDVSWIRRDDDPISKLEDRRGESALPLIPKGEGLDPWLGTVGRAVNMQEYYVARGYMISLIEWRSLGDKPRVFSPLIPPVTTDADGQFTLNGIGRERVAELYIDSVPDKASVLITVANRPLDKPILVTEEKREFKKTMSFKRDEVPIFGNKVELSLPPGRTLEGVVCDSDSRLPLAGWMVVGPTGSQLEYPGFDRFFATTDALGHYRIDNFPILSKAWFKVQPPERRMHGNKPGVEKAEKQPHFGRQMTVEIKPGTGPQTLDFPLARGVWITGRVVDDVTGQPVEDIGDTIEYHTFNDNPYLKKDLKAKIRPEFDDNLRLNHDGTFKLRAYPGRGIVTAGCGHEYLEGVGADKIKGLGRDELYETLYDTRGFSPYIRNTTIEVNIPEGVDTYTCELRLKKGKSRLVQVVGPDGIAQDNIEASGLNNQIENPIHEVSQSFFSVTNLVPGEEREVVARYVPKKLMGMAVVTAKDDGPVTLKMVPWANVTGRLVDDQGKPRFSGLRIELEDYKLPIHTINGINYDKQEFLIDPDGKFHIEGMVPGAKYRLQVVEGSIQLLGDITPDFTLKPGENRDLGDVKVTKPKDIKD